jgi:hypothetical protein
MLHRLHLHHLRLLLIVDIVLNDVVIITVLI